MTEYLNAARKGISDLILDLQDRPRLFDVNTLDSRSLIIWDRILYFWNTDAIIRLLGVKEPVENWFLVYDEAALFARDINIDKLAKLLIQTGDSDGITGLIILRLDRIESQREINKRIDAIPTLRNFIKFIDSEKIEDADNLAAHATNIYNKWAATLNKKLHAKSDGKKSIPIASKSDDDLKQEIAACYFVAYRQFQQEIKKGIEVKYTPSPFAASLPLPLWDATAPSIWKEDIMAFLRYLEPAIKEDHHEAWRKMPYRPFSRHIKNVLKQSKEASLEIPKKDKDSGKAEGYEERSDIQHRDSHEDAALFTALLSRIIQQIAEEENARKPEGILKTFLLVANGMTLKDAAKQAGISERSAKKYFSKIKNHI